MKLVPEASHKNLVYASEASFVLAMKLGPEASHKTFRRRQLNGTAATLYI
jgi:hypothetical protein